MDRLNQGGWAWAGWRLGLGVTTLWFHRSERWRNTGFVARGGGTFYGGIDPARRGWKRAARSRSGKADLILGQGRHVAKTPLMVDGGGSIVMDVGRQDITEITGHDGGRGM
ncbi:hypothetical protein MishRS11D_42530 (plasmid) [Methylomagnum ishizawai]|nr:hypothetical protein MishRS11D_42530 [Methylomagnum ishizawai]